MSRSAIIITAVTLLGVGCFTAAVDEDNWFEQSDTTYCKFLKRCSTAYFYSQWEDLDECNEDAEDVRDDNEDYYEQIQDNCDFDEDKASECMGYYNDSCKTVGEDYEDVYEACSEVWDCE